MEKDHYPSFVVSDIYSYQLMPEIADRVVESNEIANDVKLSQAGTTGHFFINFVLNPAANRLYSRLRMSTV